MVFVYVAVIKDGKLYLQVYKKCKFPGKYTPPQRI